MCRSIPAAGPHCSATVERLNLEATESFRRGSVLDRFGSSNSLPNNVDAMPWREVQDVSQYLCENKEDEEEEEPSVPPPGV